MAQQKHEIARLGRLQDYATRILKKNKAIIMCPECGVQEIDNSDEAAVSRSLVQMMKETQSDGIDASQQEIEDAVCDAMDAANIDCPDCEAETEY